eukprot:10246216-Alexandrium_andersonii.AAC.1
MPQQVVAASCKANALEGPRDGGPAAKELDAIEHAAILETVLSVRVPGCGTASKLSLIHI